MRGNNVDDRQPSRGSREHQIRHHPDEKPSESSGSEHQQQHGHSSAAYPPSHDPSEHGEVTSHASGAYHPRSGSGEQHRVSLPHIQYLVIPSNGSSSEYQLRHPSVETGEHHVHRHDSGGGHKDNDDVRKRSHLIHAREMSKKRITILRQAVPCEAPKQLQDGVREEEWRVFHDRYDTPANEGAIGDKMAGKAKEVAVKAFGKVGSMFA